MLPSFDGLKKAATLIATATIALAAAPVQAQSNSIFPAGWDGKVRDRLFMRLGYTTAFTKTDSGEVKDLSGDAVSRQQIFDALKRGETADPGGFGGFSDLIGSALFGDYYLDQSQALGGFFGITGLSGIGTPSGVKAKAQDRIGTPTVSVGYWLDEDRKWLLEGFVLAKPMDVKIYGDAYRLSGQPNTINGKHIVSTKLLPPLVIGSYNFGEKNSVVRPYLGIGVMYAIFFDGKATNLLSDYVGGKTTISTKNTFGAGPFVGLQAGINEDWHVNVSVGRIGLRATSKLVTSNTNFTSQSAVLQDFYATGSGSAENDFPAAVALVEDPYPGFTTQLLQYVKQNNGNSASLGTFVREQKMKITNTIVTISVGRSF